MSEHNHEHTHGDCGCGGEHNHEHNHEHKHNHDHGDCGCGGEHTHEHNHEHKHNHDHDDCGCGGDHTHEHEPVQAPVQEHGCGCGGHVDNGGGCCGSNGGGCCGTAEEHTQEPVSISDVEHQFLMALAEVSFLPVARFVMGSTKSEHLFSVALEPVFIQEEENPIDEIKALGEGLLHLEEFGLITLDYDQPLDGFDYSVYENSAVYKDFQQVILEAKTHEDFLFDSGSMEKGSMALTVLGQGAVEQLQTTD